MKKFFLLFYLLFAFTPLVVRGEVLITEIAWMGTTSSTTDDEWIELYNSGAEAVDLSLWTIEADDGTPHISLGGAIGGSSFFILERTDDTTLPNIIAGLIYAGALENGGEKLYLKNNGVIVQTIDGSTGWPAGDNTTKDTMQWSGTGWITATPTPVSVSFVENNDGSQEEDGNNTPPQNNKDEEKNTSSATPVEILSVHYAPAPLVYIDKAIPVYVSAGRDRLVARDALVVFDAFSETEDGEYIQANDYEWTFGDGAWARGKMVSHRYVRPGTYVVILNATYPNSSAVDKAMVTVFEPAVSITNVADIKGPFVEITNKGETDINLYEWSLSDSGRGVFLFPKDTIIEKGNSVQFPNENLGLRLDGTITLNDSIKNNVSVFDTRLSLAHTTSIIGGQGALTSSPSVIVVNTKVVETKTSVEVEPPRQFVRVDTKTPPIATKIRATETASGTIIFEGKRNSGLMAGLLAIPQKVFGFVKNLIF